MVQIAGNYKLDKNENLSVYLKSLGVPEELAQKAETPGLTLEVVVEGNKYSFKSSSKINLEFTLDEEFEEPFAVAGIVLKSIAKLNGNKITVTSKTDDGRTGTRTYEFTDSGLTLTLTSKDITAKRYYSRT
ncbi:hypothetical protein ILUMI_07031 [Ignelater luminosus]|uniref:Fatty acid-binding protein n=1 Tax=Ignelater luminosus TaxID=2038154 RepID=A0A8K0GIF8_IGNLU|nr:hypothetical protein ILUMI_07031 [Ignelater luminosus]